MWKTQLGGYEHVLLYLWNQMLLCQMFGSACTAQESWCLKCVEFHGEIKIQNDGG